MSEEQRSARAAKFRRKKILPSKTGMDEWMDGYGIIDYPQGLIRGGERKQEKKN